jgi:hypothetical protein
MDHPASAPPGDQRQAVEVRLLRVLMVERMRQLLERLRAVGHDSVEKTRRLLEE